MKSYAGRSLFNGLLSAPAARKRAGVLDILAAFPDSKFFLVGDSGEQDLELYTSLAAERPWQILAVFVRDAGPHTDDALLDDPTGWRIVEGRKGGPGGSQSAAPILAAARLADMIEQEKDMVTPTQGSFRPDSPQPAFASEERPKARRGISDLAAAKLNETKNKAKALRTPRHSSSVGAEPQFFSSPGSGRNSSSTSSLSSDTSSVSSVASYMPKRKTTQELSALTPGERRRYDLQMRVWSARTQIPSHIPLRIFRKPEECVEMYPILTKLMPVSSGPNEHNH